jgi:hypothetical protein
MLLCIRMRATPGRHSTGLPVPSRLMRVVSMPPQRYPTTAGTTAYWGWAYTISHGTSCIKPGNIQLYH